MTRLGYAITTTAAVSLLGILSLVSFAPKLVWNASASTPIGLYAIEPDRSPEVTDLVAVRAPEPLASFLAEGGYLPRGVPLMKRIVALPGQRVCRTGLVAAIRCPSGGAAASSPRASCS
jgi:type IV secretory pathway protease TraF